MNTTAFSIVIITHNRDKHVKNVLRGIEVSEMQPDEVVIVYMNQANELPGNYSLQLKAVHLETDETLPLAQARNLGIASANTDIVIFLDADCVPSSTMFSHLLEDSHIRDGLVMGTPYYLKPNVDLDSVAITDSLLESNSVSHDGRAGLAAGISNEYTAFWSLCFALTKTTFNKIGGFDTGYVGYGGEDTDFGLCAEKANVPFVISDARCYHQRHDVYKPPVQHVSDIVINSNYFFKKWGIWPMKGWLRKFLELKLIEWQPDQHHDISVLRTLTQSESDAYKDTISPY